MTVKPLNPNRQIILSNAINEARFKMSKAEQKLFLYFIGVVDNRENALDRPFEMSISEFADYLELKRKDLHKSMRQVTKEFASRVIEIKRSDDELIQLPVLSKVHYKKGRVEIKVNSELKPYLIDLKKQFTQFSLSEVLSFKSLYSIRIYQILSQWIYKGGVEYSLEELKFMLNISEIQYKRYNDFKKDVLDVALKEINNSSSLKYTYKEIKTGRKVTSIAFTVKTTKKPKKDEFKELISVSKPILTEQIKPYSVQEPLPRINLTMVDYTPESPETTELIARLNKLGLSIQNSKKIIEECGENYTLFALEKSKIEARDKVENKAGYFTSVIGTYRDLYKDERQRDEELKEEARMSQERQEQRERELKEKEERFKQEQEELSRDILEQEPELFCKAVFGYMDTFLDTVTWGFMYHPDWYKNRENNQGENMKIAKDIRSKFRACSSLRDFRNIIKYDEEWLFRGVFNTPEQFEKESSSYYKAKHNVAKLDKIQLPFKI